MRRALVGAFAAAARRWPIVILLWAVGATFGVLFSLAAGRWLGVALNASLASRTLLTELNLDLLGELFQRHRESLALLMLVAAVLAVVYLLFAIWLNAGVVRAVQDADTRFPLFEFWYKGFLLYPVFLRLWVLATTLEVAVVLATVVGVRKIDRWFVESPNELSTYFVLAAGVAIAASGLFVLMTVHDHARIYAARKRTGAFRALRWASWFVLRGDRRAVMLGIALVLAGGVVWLGYRAIASAIPVTTSTGVTISLLWGQVLLQARALLRVATFTAETDLQAELPE